MAQLDVFGRPEFDMANLTTAINALPYKPGLIGSMGVFQNTPINTTTAKVEKREGKLSLLGTAARSTVANARSQPDRVVRTFELPHMPQFQTVMADDIQNIRAFGSETELEMVSAVVNDQLQGMRANHETTHEYHRVGAINGLILNADGSSTIYDLYADFDVTEITHDITVASDDPAAYCNKIVRDTANELGADRFDGIVALCSDGFFDAFTSMALVKDAYRNSQANSWMRQSQLGPEYGPYANGFEFGGILWLNYRGQIGDVPFITADEAKTFPTGVSQMFQEICGPAPSMGVANTRGQLIYASQYLLPHDIGIELKTSSDCLMLNSRPAACITLTFT